MANSVQDRQSGMSPSWIANGTSVLNGMFGDYLCRRKNGLAIDMAFMHHESPLVLERKRLSEITPTPSPRICILIHGLCCNEGSWRLRGETASDDTTYGAMLQRDLGYTPFYLRYNSGMPIADNGALFSDLMGTLMAAYPVKVDEIVLIGHSMGGLVIRSACESAMENGKSWVRKVSKSFYLGTPHEGADLEKVTHVATQALNAIPNPITNVIGSVLNLRSRGIKDLRHGAPLAGNKKTARALPKSRHDARKSVARVPWLGHAQHFLIGGTLTQDPQHLMTRIFGDALVKMPRRRRATDQGEGQLLAKNLKVFSKVHHMALAHDRLVYEQIRRWCSTKDTSMNEKDRDE